MCKLDTLPLFEQLENSQNILIAGAGGGYDIYSGIPLFLALQNQQKSVYLANLSFAILGSFNSEKEFEKCWRITPHNQEYEYSYFPEKYLSIWLENNHLNSTVYAFEQTGVIPLYNSYKHLVDKLNIDTVILIDGGTDSLMFGNEPGLGTPTEDMTSIIAVSKLDVKQKFLVCLGFGVDDYHGVDHYYFLENVALLTKLNSFLGVFSILPQMKEAQLFNNLIQFANAKMKSSPSIVSNSINSSIQGNYGNYHTTYKTRDTELWINPLMSMYWTFKLSAVAANIKYPDTLTQTYNTEEVMEIIFNYRKNTKIKENKKIPL